MENEDFISEIEKNYIKKQNILCDKFKTDFEPSPFTKIIGVAIDTMKNNKKPINGLRHPIENSNSTSWFIWTGEYSDNNDFFTPIHVHHLLELSPEIIHYLGLPPGWRFLMDGAYEDIWYDENLLNI